MQMLGLGGNAQTISAEEAHSQQVAGELVIVDIRQPNEWAQTGIPAGSYRITLGTQNFAPQIKGLAEENPDSKIALFCASGMRSGSAIGQLKAAGIENLYNIKGGFGAWSRGRLPIDPA